jgi:hypothetical protein
LRLEIGTNIDKKKPEFYFLSRIKKILTEKLNRHCPEHEKILSAREVDRRGARAHFSPLRQ